MEAHNGDIGVGLSTVLITTFGDINTNGSFAKGAFPSQRFYLYPTTIQFFLFDNFQYRCRQHFTHILTIGNTTSNIG